MFMSCTVPSWAVTTHQLEAWGFTLRVTDKCVGSKVVLQEGMTAHEAKHAAWARGFVHVACLPEHIRQAQVAAFHAGIAEMRREAVENLAFLRAHGTITEGRGSATIMEAAA